MQSCSELYCLVLNELLSRENTLSATAEDGCISIVFLATEDQLGNAYSFRFHQSIILTVALTLSALARQTGNSVLATTATSHFRELLTKCHWVCQSHEYTIF